MASKIALFIEGENAGVFDVQITDDRTGFSPIKMDLSVLTPSYDIKKVYIDKLSSEVTTALITFAGANGKWLVSKDPNALASTFSSTITINTFPGYFWIKALCTGNTEEPGEDTATVLRITTSSQTDLFDLMRVLRTGGIIRFDTDRSIFASGLIVASDTNRIKGILGTVNLDTLRTMSATCSNDFDAFRLLKGKGVFAADTLRRLYIPKKNYYFIL